MTADYLCTAIGTPLDPDDELHAEGLRAHLNQQAQANVNGILVAGTMGAMPLLKHSTYARLIRESVRLWQGKGELLVGVGDASFSRTRERIQLVNELPVDGAVVLTPYLFQYSQAELRAYFEALAKESSAPLYLYDLPQRTGNQLAIDTICRLAGHPNIAGIKCSCDADKAHRLVDALADSEFRVMVAQASQLNTLLRAGLRQHVDGVYAVVPQIVSQIFVAAAKEDWARAASLTACIRGVLAILVKYGVLPAATTLLNFGGIPGNFAPRPHQPLSSQAQEELLAEPEIRAALSGEIASQGVTMSSSNA